MSTFLWANNKVTFNVGVFIAASSALIHACIEHQQHHQLQQSSLAIITSYHSNGLLVLVTRVMLLNSACSMSAVLSFYCRIVHQCTPIRINLPDVHYEHGHHLPVEHSASINALSPRWWCAFRTCPLSPSCLWAVVSNVRACCNLGTSKGTEMGISMSRNAHK